MTKIDKNSVAALIGTTFIGTLSAGTVNATENPFALKDLATGYAQVAEAEAAKENKGKKEMACGARKDGAGEAKPQYETKPQYEGAAPRRKSIEGKCGAGK